MKAIVVSTKTAQGTPLGLLADRSHRDTILRRSPSGSAGDPDIFGSPQYAPLLSLQVPDAA